MTDTMQTDMDADDRPGGYRYLDILQEHLGGSLAPVFNGEAINPRQLEIHLPSNGEMPCNFRCRHCQGGLLDQSLGNWESDALALLDDVAGEIPFVIYGGAYTEPLLNPYFLDFLRATKANGSSFGIHTNGSLLLEREREEGFLSTLCSISTSPDDYLSISLDAGTSKSHCATKGLTRDWFSEIMQGIEMAVDIRGLSKHPSIRVCYLMNKHNSSVDELDTIVKDVQDLGIDSLRFSIPYDRYGKDFERVRRYRARVEAPTHVILSQRLKPFLSRNADAKPFVFYLPPVHQDVNRMDFDQYIYSYYQITLAADGFVYKCSSVASSSFKPLRLGRITADRKKFDRMVSSNHNSRFTPSKCFAMGARCNRIALEINTSWNEEH